MAAPQIASTYLAIASQLNKQNVPNDPRFSPFVDPAVRASMISQGLAVPGQAIPGSNVPGVQTPFVSQAAQTVAPGFATQTAGVGGIPTRQSAGLGGDAAMQLSARAYQDMLRRQIGMEVSGINVAFGGAGRFTSGQRGAAIQEAQQGGRQAFSDAFARMALQRYLGEQDIGSRERITQAQLEAAGGQGRTQLTGDILQSLAIIFSANPDWLKSIGGGIKSGVSSIGGFFQGGGGGQPLGPGF